MSSTELKRIRKPRARGPEIVLAAIDERLVIIAEETGTIENPHIDRLRELLDELKRAIGKPEERES